MTMAQLRTILERGLITGKWSIQQFNKKAREPVRPGREFLEENLATRCRAIIRSVSSRVSIAEPRGDCGIPFVLGSTEFVAELENKIFVASRVSYSTTSTLSNSTSGGGARKPSGSSDFNGLFKSGK